ncbi:MAG: sigma-70 family RNA polymerase sigma factor [Sphingobacteriales bacterium]|nr:MAG: sigma-70 family RNA polymerase sigma factor [Sphingobacteriales bacterium]
MQDQIQDATIIAEVLQGKQQSYAVLVDRYQHFVFTLVLRYIPQREEAEEVAQDVFVKAYRYLADFHGRSKFSTWLYTIVNTTCISYLRKRKDPSFSADEEQLIFLGEQATFAGNQKHQIDVNAERAVIDRAISMLPGTDGRIITLFYLDDQSVEEIGTILGLTVSNVKVRLFRARQKLRSLLQTQMS